MRIYLIVLFTASLLFSVCGCDTVTTNDAEVNDTVAETDTAPEPESDTEMLADCVELSADIYFCDDVYLTADTPTHGSGTITLPQLGDALQIVDYQLLLCGDGCEPAAVVSRASEGYAVAYRTVEDVELDGNFRILKFKKEIPEPMVDDLKQAGSYDDTVERLGREYYYLLVLDEKHYAYINLVSDEDVSELADEVIKNTAVQYESEPAKIELILPKVRELADKGEELTWNDFERYNSTDVGSGLYILHFELDDAFDLFVGGVPVPDGKPMYVKLALDADSDKYIDIRTDDINAFIDEMENME